MEKLTLQQVKAGVEKMGYEITEPPVVGEVLIVIKAYKDGKEKELCVDRRTREIEARTIINTTPWECVGTIPDPNRKTFVVKIDLTDEDKDIYHNFCKRPEYLKFVLKDKLNALDNVTVHDIEIGVDEPCASE